ncbi:MAG: hypothetical protein ACYC65_11960 [Candidatus Limnocylindrales bacterium]
MAGDPRLRGTVRRLAPVAGRTLAAGAGRKIAALAGCTVAAGAAVIALLAGAAVALAGSPSPTGAAGGDPRSSGQGPGLVGDPLLAVVLVAAIALASLGATLVYVRLTGGPRGSRPGR